LELANAKVVLIELPSTFAHEAAMNPPLGLCSIAAHLKTKNMDVVGIDLSMDMLEDIPTADFYGIHCLTPQYDELLKTVQYIRDTFGWYAVIIVGGPHVTSIPGDIPNSADFVVRGEGEDAILELVESYTAPSKEVYWLDDLDNYPFPDRSVFGLERYKRTLCGSPAVHIMTIRGCPFSCSYCNKEIVGKRVRKRSVEHVMEEVDFIKSVYGIKSFIIYDDIFTLDRKRVATICDEFRRRGIKWRCWSRADTLDKEILTLMKASGLTSITLGIESGDDAVLSSVDKGLTADKNRKALLLTRELEIPVRCSLMFGNPGESWKSLSNTINMIEETQPDEWNLAVLQPIPGSDIWNNPHKYDIEFDKQWVKDNKYRMCNRFGESGVGDIWYKFVNRDVMEFGLMLNYFASELERVCPRRTIQDTIQKININKVEVLHGTTGRC